MFFQKELETLNRREIEIIQLERLKYTVAHCYNNVPFYREKLDAAKVYDGSKMKTLADIKYIPFTTKDDFRENYPYGMSAVQLSDNVRLHASSGTTGKPTVGLYTKHDLDIWSDCVARVAVAGGVTEDDIVQVSFGYGLFTGALGLHYGLEKIGALVIPASSGNTERQLMMMRDFGVTGLVATPSYGMYLAEALNEEAFALSDYRLQLGLFGSEPCTPGTREHIERRIGIFVTDNYGMTELGGPGVSGECKLRDGLHFAEDHYLPEIIDPDTLEPIDLKSGTNAGEMIITTLTREAMPVLRYRTRDISTLNYEPCACGRTHVRMEKVTGRTDDMLIIKGVNVFPMQIEAVLANMRYIQPHYQLIIRRENFKDTLEIKVETTDEVPVDRFIELQNIQNEVKRRLRGALGLEAKVTLVPAKSLERFQGKAKRILDLRNAAE